MAYAASQDFKDKIKDQTSAKSCLILFDDLFFSTSDFTDSGVVFSQYFNTSDDLTFGDCPSDTLSFSVVANGALAGYSFGECRAYLGVQTDSQPYAFGSINAHIEVGAYTWTASNTGLYCDGSLIDNGEYVSLISDGTYVYAVGLSSSYRANIDGSDGSAWTPNRFMAQKLRSGLSAVFSANTAYAWDGTNVLKYEYVPMGVYLVEKPRSTVGDTVVVQDAYDQMKLFDLDASQFLGGLTYPITLSGIYTALCDFVGVSYASSTFTYSTTSYASSPFSDTSCTLRDILWWIAERARAVAHFDREGRIDLTWLTTTLDIFTAVGATTGKYINASGGLSSHSQWSATDYLFVYPNTEYTFSKTGSGGNASYFAFYTEGKEFISSVGDETTLTFTTPSNARYARFSYRTTEEPTVSIVMSATEVLTASDIGQDGYSIAEYLTPAVTGVLLKGTNGSSLTFGTMDTPYVISANPFVSTISNSDLNAYWQIPRYVPMELNVLEADPSIDVGDLISVKPMVDEVVLLANVYNEIYVNSSLEAYALNAPEYSIPLMERQISFIGAIRAKYTATGNEVREADISNTEYNANVAAKIAEENIDKEFTQQEVFNRLTNNGQAQGIFLDSNGNLYVNGTYIQAHTVAVDKLTGTIRDSGNTWEIDLTNGTMTIGKVYASNISVTDLSAIGATIGAFTIDSDSIYSGTKGSGTANGDITLTTSTFSRSIGGTNRSNLKFAIGGNFGVGKDGTVYASSAVITGGSINIESSTGNFDYIKLRYNFPQADTYTIMSSNTFEAYRKIGSTAETHTYITPSYVSVVDLLGGYSVGINTSNITFGQPGTPAKVVTIQPVIVASW